MKTYEATVLLFFPNGRWRLCRPTAESHRMWNTPGCASTPWVAVLRGRAGCGSITRGGNPEGKAGQVMSGRELAGEDAGFDTGRPHMARVYDFWLDGKDNISQEERADFRDRV